MKIITCIVLFNLFLNAYGNQLFPVGPERVGRSDSGIYGPSYDEIKDNLKSLSIKYSQYAQIINLGLSEDGTEMLGILLAKKGVTVNKFYMTSGVTHGNEYLGIADKLPNAFLDPQNKVFYDFYNRGGAIVVIPIVNPYGYKERIRYNANEEDLNRDYSNLITGITRFTQAETQNLDSWVDSFISSTDAKLEVSVDYHCCFYRGALLFPWAYTKRTPLSAPELQKHNEVGDLLKKYHPNIKTGPTTDILWYWADGTSMDYWYARYGGVAVTYEGVPEVENESLGAHISWWKDLIAR